MSSLLLLCAITLGLVVVLMVEGLRHARALKDIPVRIHVNGTRGKSSVTRLIAAGLRAGGKRVCAKTTGTLARVIVPDGAEFPVFRPSRANVLEQLRIIKLAAEFRAEILVIECMAVHPILQSLTELRFVKATHGVLTNARPDHLDVMGPSERDVAEALAATTPIKGKLFTTEVRNLEVFKASCTDRASTLVSLGEDDVLSEVTEEDLAGFTYLEHASNVALALRVCEEFGIDRSTALKGMWSAKPDPGALTVYHLSFFGRELTFVNAFAANDPESTGQIWQRVCSEYDQVEQRIALVNCRGDRADRSRQLGAHCSQWGDIDHFIVIGSGTFLFGKEAAKGGLDVSRITYAEDLSVEEIFEIVVDRAGRSALIIGVANIGGQGLELVRYFRNRSKIQAL